MLNKKQITGFKTALEARKKQIKENLKILKERDNENVLENESISLLEQQAEELAEIELSLSRIKENIYGICEMCEEEIDIERLEVKIFARYCMTCRKIIDKEYSYVS